MPGIHEWMFLNDGDVEMSKVLTVQAEHLCEQKLQFVRSILSVAGINENCGGLSSNCVPGRQC